MRARGTVPIGCVVAAVGMIVLAPGAVAAPTGAVPVLDTRVVSLAPGDRVAAVVRITGPVAVLSTVDGRPVGRPPGRAAAAAANLADWSAGRWLQLVIGALVLLGAGFAAWRWVGFRRPVSGAADPDDDVPGCEAERAAVRAAAAAYEYARAAADLAETRVTQAERAIGEARELLAEVERGYTPTRTAHDRAELRRDVPGITLPAAADPAQESWEEQYLAVLYAEEELRLRVVELVDIQRWRDDTETALVRSTEALARCRSTPKTAEPGTPAANGDTPAGVVDVSR